jgi:hypothetical protein
VLSPTKQSPSYEEIALGEEHTCPGGRRQGRCGDFALRISIKATQETKVATWVNYYKEKQLSANMGL